MYSRNHRLFNHRFFYNLALRIEMAEGNKRLLVAVCLDVAASVTEPGIKFDMEEV